MSLDAVGPIYRRDSYPAEPVFYVDWEHDEANRIVVHIPTGCSFAVWRHEGELVAQFVAIRHGGASPFADDLRRLGSLAVRWFTVFGLPRSRAPLSDS